MRKVRFPAANRLDLVPDTAIVVPLGSEGECALLLHEGRIYALGSLCPHQNASLSGARAAQGCLTCSRHGYRFELVTGDCVTLGGYGLPTYPTDVEGDTVFITYWEFD